MCGIAGWVAYDQNLAEQRHILQRMTDTMALRGPDAEGLWIDGACRIGAQASRDHRSGRWSPTYGGAEQRRRRRHHLLTGEVYNFVEIA